jgi:hypothetical protein
MWARELLRDPSRLAAVLALLGYLGVALALGNLYPFSVFDMYSRRFTSASRIVARDAGGHVREVERYARWSCDEPLDVSPGRCGAPGSFFYVPYLDTDGSAYVAAHAGDGQGQPVDVVRRIWWLEGGGPPRVEDCLLSRCRAVLK